MIKTGDFILERMRELKYIQNDLVLRSGICKGYISLIISNKRALTIRNAIQLAKALKVKPNYLMKIQSEYLINEELKRVENINKIRRLNYRKAS